VVQALRVSSAPTSTPPPSKCQRPLPFSPLPAALFLNPRPVSRATAPLSLPRLSLPQSRPPPLRPPPVVPLSCPTVSPLSCPTASPDLPAPHCVAFPPDPSSHRYLRAAHLPPSPWELLVCFRGCEGRLVLGACVPRALVQVWWTTPLTSSNAKPSTDKDCNRFSWGARR